MKSCAKCKETKPLDEFYRATKSKDGRYSYCKACAREASTAWARANPAKRKLNDRIQGKRRTERRLLAPKICRKCGAEFPRRPRSVAQLCPACQANAKNGYLVTYEGDGRYSLVHREVMLAAIGRPLHPDETVHHRNGDKQDNRLENLELWSTRHPKGQRAIDLLEFAREIIARYEGLSPL